MDAKTDYSRVLREFGFRLPTEGAPRSIHPFAPVFRVSDARGEWIVKRAQAPLERASAIAAWVRALAAGSVRVVTPAEGFGENPRAIPSDDDVGGPWVVYPYISGEPYTGETAQISAAGELLGRIHATTPDGDFGLKRSETVVAIGAAEIDRDIEGISGRVSGQSPQHSEEARRILFERREEYLKDVLPNLLTARLPLTNCVWDYKASNLVFPSAASPVLVDPDSGGRIPRAYDLAISALLFHNEGQGPGRLFMVAEWQAFLAGYGLQVQLDEEERSAWNGVLLSAWIDEGLWLLREDEHGWSDPRQRRMLTSLLTKDLSELSLLPGS